MQDFRKILLPYCTRKVDFEEMNEPGDLTHEAVNALQALIDNYQFKSIKKNASSWDTTFKSGDSEMPDRNASDEEWLAFYAKYPLEWIIQRGNDEFYYVDNEGYTYCRYGFRIPEDVLNSIL